MVSEAESSAQVYAEMIGKGLTKQEATQRAMDLYRLERILKCLKGLVVAMAVLVAVKAGEAVMGVLR